MKRICLAVFLLAALTGAAFAGGEKEGASKLTLKWGDVQPGTHPSVQMIDRAAAEVAEKTSGRLEINSFPGGQLGGSRDMIEAVSTGTQEIVTEGSANFGQWVPSIAITEAPYIWRDADHLIKVLHGPIGEDFSKELVAKRGMRILGATYYGIRQLTTTSRRVEKVADMNGLKLRVPENDVFRAMAEAWGARPTPMNFNELYLALQQNVVDGQENPLPTIDSGKFQEIQKYLILTGHIITPRLVVINEGVWQKISAADQKILQDAVRSAIEWQNGQILSQESSLIDKFKAAGVTVIQPDVAEFRKVVLDVVPKKFEANWGAGMWDKIQAVK
ncbi:MAG: sialic acid TRAP transporter substrate-binding protein SiaP [Spirochaetales bacterium]|jgi:tripartite ATP-independent transporter DctP family solute receptor|nr:sialic acid TRAP transporter substrate-binding protein SiaP [Spirochaetales bacterium]